MGSKASEGKEGAEKAPPRMKQSQNAITACWDLLHILPNLPVESLRNPFSKPVFLSYNLFDFGEMVKPLLANVLASPLLTLLHEGQKPEPTTEALC